MVIEADLAKSVSVLTTNREFRCDVVTNVYRGYMALLDKLGSDVLQCNLIGRRKSAV